MKHVVSCKHSLATSKTEHKVVLQMPVKALLQTVALMDPEALSEQAADEGLQDGQVHGQLVMPYPVLFCS